MFSIAIVIVLMVWAILSLANQFANSVPSISRWLWYIKRFDHGSLIPVWTFFAPNPGTRDYNLLMRSRYLDGSYSPWRQFIDNIPPATRAFWNPSKRPKKAILDLCMFLSRSALRYSQAPREEAAGLYVSLPYLGLANVVTARSIAQLACEVQFIVVMSHGHVPEREPDILFVSPLFRLQ